MSISYIKSNLSKLGPDHLYRFLLDLITKGDFDSVTDFDTTKTYHYNDKVYVYKDKKHHIYECRVENSASGGIRDDEWLDLIDSFNNITADDILNKLFIVEETYEAKIDTSEIPIQYEGFDIDLCKVMVYHSIQGRLSSDEFIVNESSITLKNIVMNKGEYVIIDIFEFDNKYNSNGINPRGYVTVKFVDTKDVPIVDSVSYYGKLGEQFQVYPRYIDGYQYNGYSGELIDTFDVDTKIVTFRYTKN